MTVDRIEREVLIEAPVERVWELLTEAEHLGTWFADAGAEVDLRPGGELVMHWEDHGSAKGRFERIEPPNELSLRWAPFRDPSGDQPEEGNSTLVEFSLAAEAEGTRVRVVESGFASLATSDEQRQKNVEGNTEGWAMELGHLAEHAAKIAA
jgi:uncharacterized protein YndB with AHSA1/START domain